MILEDAYYGLVNDYNDLVDHVNVIEKLLDDSESRFKLAEICYRDKAKELDDLVAKNQTTTNTIDSLKGQVQSLKDTVSELKRKLSQEVSKTKDLRNFEKKGKHAIRKLEENKETIKNYPILVSQYKTLEKLYNTMKEANDRYKEFTDKLAKGLIHFDGTMGLQHLQYSKNNSDPSFYYQVNFIPMQTFDPNLTTYGHYDIIKVWDFEILLTTNRNKSYHVETTNIGTFIIPIDENENKAPTGVTPLIVIEVIKRIDSLLSCETTKTSEVMRDAIKRLRGIDVKGIVEPEFYKILQTNKWTDLYTVICILSNVATDVFEIDKRVMDSSKPIIEENLIRCLQHVKDNDDLLKITTKKPEMRLGGLNLDKFAKC